MADNKQVDSRIDGNSTSPRQVYSEQQLAKTDAEFAADRAAAKAGDAAFRAASHRPAQKNMTPELDANDFGIPFTVTPAPPAPKGRSTRKGK